MVYTNSVYMIQCIDHVFVIVTQRIATIPGKRNETNSNAQSLQNLFSGFTFLACTKRCTAQCVGNRGTYLRRSTIFSNFCC